MAYNRENILRRIIEIQDITLREKAVGKTQEYIFENLIKPRFMISRGTYYNYLGINARHEIKRLKNT